MLGCTNEVQIELRQRKASRRSSAVIEMAFLRAGISIVPACDSRLDGLASDSPPFLPNPFWKFRHPNSYHLFHLRFSIERLLKKSGNPNLRTFKTKLLMYVNTEKCLHLPCDFLSSLARDAPSPGEHLTAITWDIFWGIS
jgi:hypothetical protein